MIRNESGTHQHNRRGPVVRLTPRHVLRRQAPPPHPQSIDLFGREHAVKGDRVEVVIDAGTSTRSYEVAATRAGRRVDVSHGRGMVEVAEVTRTGVPVRTARFMASRVIALVEHPADEDSPHPA
jgi:hypothetical protein